MCRLSEETIKKNYATYHDAMCKIIGEEITDNLFDALGGEKRIMYAPYDNMADSGMAHEGGFIRNIIRMAKYANGINTLLPETNQLDKNTINKICLLSQIAKIPMYEPNDNNWEIANRGMLYKFNNLDGALRVGERSILFAMNAGVKFTEIEFEAMKILDKDSSTDNYIRLFSSTLSTIIRQAAELVEAVNKKR